MSRQRQGTEQRMLKRCRSVGLAAPPTLSPPWHPANEQLGDCARLNADISPPRPDPLGKQRPDSLCDVIAQSSGWREELERDAVGVAKAQSRAVGRVHDAAVVDAELVESRHPLLQLRAVGAAEADVIQAHSELAESLVGSRKLV